MNTADSIPNGYRRQASVAVGFKGTHKTHDPFYNTAQWQKLRKIVLGEEPVCRLCSVALACPVDHLDNDQTNNALCNLAPLCDSCHTWKTRTFDCATKFPIETDADLLVGMSKLSHACIYPRPWVCQRQFVIQCLASLVYIDTVYKRLPGMRTHCFNAYEIALEEETIHDSGTYTSLMQPQHAVDNLNGLCRTFMLNPLSVRRWCLVASTYAYKHVGVV